MKTRTAWYLVTYSNNVEVRGDRATARQAIIDGFKAGLGVKVKRLP